MSLYVVDRGGATIFTVAGQIISRAKCFLVLSPSLLAFLEDFYFSVIAIVAKQNYICSFIYVIIFYVIICYMFMFNVTPHNKLMLICDNAAYVAPPFKKNLDIDPTYRLTSVRRVKVCTVMARYAVPISNHDPQCDIYLRQSRNTS
jgi:hypothetical protein